MNRGLLRGWIVAAVAGLLVSAAGGGCQQAQTPDAKQARLIAAENMQLEKDLADRDAQIQKLKADYEKQVKAVGERGTQVTTAVMDENARLRKEIETLRAKIEKRKGNGEP